MSAKNIKKAYTRHRNNRTMRQRAANRLRPLRNAVLIMALLGGLVGGLSYGTSPIRTLAYATNINHTGLLASTNQQRSANGLATLALNGQLNSAAQAKANDMAAKDYWSHTSPDGSQPWDFIIAAGYSYNNAGENLAYGALTSEQTVQAWMDSPGHRANILNTKFMQVGFGFANSANYQGSGPQTIVVAMYATPYGMQAPAPPVPTPEPTPAPTPTPAPAAPVAAAKPAAPAAPTQQPADVPPAAADEPTSNKDTDDEQVEDDEDTAAMPTKIDENGKKTITPTEQTQSIRRISLITGNYASWVVAMVVIGGIIAAGAVLYRHSKAWHRLISKGEDFIIKHPIFDALAILAVIVVIILLQSVGHVL